MANTVEAAFYLDGSKPSYIGRRTRALQRLRLSALELSDGGAAHGSAAKRQARHRLRMDDPARRKVEFGQERSPSEAIRMANNHTLIVSFLNISVANTTVNEY